MSVRNKYELSQAENILWHAALDTSRETDQHRGGMRNSSSRALPRDCIVPRLDCEFRCSRGFMHTR